MARRRAPDDSAAASTEAPRKPRRQEGFRERIRLSLVLRLNLHTVWRLLWILLSINLFLLLIATSAVFIQAENRSGQTAIAIRDETDPVVRARLTDLLADMNSYSVSIDRYGKTWPDTTVDDGEAAAWFTRLRLDGMRAATSAQRGFIAPDDASGLSPVDWLQGLSYRLQYPLAESSGLVYTVITVTVPLWQPVLHILIPLAFLVLFELLLFLGSIPAGTRSARRILKPIGEMSRMTRNINASRLDTRLNLRGSQNELKDLAETINDMLERIHTAYRSQIRFVSDASHELRTPIAVIQGYANLLDRWGKNDPQTLQESIGALKTESESMKELVEKLLFLARGDNNTLTLHMEPLFVDRLVRQLARETMMIDKNHVFRVAREDHLAVVADAQLLKQALRILIDNSIKYTPPGNEIVIACSADPGGLVRVSVQDSGIGIPAADVPFIFDRFYRADESRARKTGGTGLGLSIAKWIVERHNGRIDVLSRQGFGTRMSILLPRVVQAAQLAQAESAAVGEDSRNGHGGKTADPDGAVILDHPIPPGLR